LNNTKQFVPSGQNPSGHITMDSQQARFFQEIMAKDHKMMNLRQWGLLEYKRDRNPMEAERSPRGEFIGFDFTVPHKEPEPEKWVYPDIDWGLMAKFRSQKPIYDVIFQREGDEPQLVMDRERFRQANKARIQAVIREQKEIQMKAHEESLAEEQRLKELEAMMEDPHKYHDDNKQRIKAAKLQALRSRQLKELDASLFAMDGDGDNAHDGAQQHGHHHHHHPPRSLSLDQFLDPNHDKTDHSSLAAVARSTKQNINKIKDEFRSKRYLEDFKINTIKDLQHTNPQVLAEYRATRAAQFIHRQGERALHPPPTMPADGPFFETAPAFRGGGILVASTRELEAQAKKHAAAKLLLPQRLQTSAPRSLRRVHDAPRPQQQHHSANAATGNVDVVLLQKQLQDTENEIERQRLRMALKTKSPKPYESSQPQQQHQHQQQLQVTTSSSPSLRRK
jgi:hypothetical protein